MHKVVSMILKAENDEQAIELAEQAFDYLIEHGQGGHDYYTMFNSEDDKQGTTVSGTDRWGKRENPVLLADVETREYLHEMLRQVAGDFARNFDEVRVAFNTKPIKDLMEDDWATWKAGQLYLEDISNCDNMIYKAYDDGSIASVHTEKQLEEAEKEDKCNYVVFADVHF